MHAPGDVITGVLVSVSAEHAFLDLGGKAEGMVPREELLDDDGTLRYAIGDSLEARVVGHAASDGNLRLSIAAIKDVRDEAVLVQAYEGEIPVEGVVQKLNKGGYEVKIGSREAFCPISQIEATYTEDPSVHLGQRYAFLVTEYASGGRQFVVSRAALQRREREELLTDAASRLKPGSRVTGTVTRLADFGAFVDLGGLDGLIPMRELSWSRVAGPEDAVQIGETVTVKILEVDLERKRVSLSLREASASPWESVQFEAGDRLEGTVTRLADFGAFVELSPGLDGLLHVSEMRGEKSIRRPSDRFSVGDRVDVVIRDVDRIERRISLGLGAPGSNPWTSVATTLPIGSLVRARVARHAEFGIFVELVPGLKALLPHDALGDDIPADLSGAFPVDHSLVVAVQAIDASRRRAVVSRAAALDPEGKERAPNAPVSIRAEGGASSLGTLGDVLAEKLKGLKLDP